MASFIYAKPSRYGLRAASIKVEVCKIKALDIVWRQKITIPIKK